MNSNLEKLETVINNLQGRVYFNFPAKDIAHYQIGGLIDCLYFPLTIADCSTAIKRANDLNIPIFIFGKGSNLIISDEGFRGIFIALDDACNRLELNRNENSYCGAGIVLWDLIEKTIEAELGDMTNMSWIPGTVGGALFMNAGAFGSEIEEFVESVDVLTSEGELKNIKHDDCGFAYRIASELQDKIILGATLKLKPADQKKMRSNSNDIIEKRKSKQPLDYPSCGSVFKRPPGLFAGTLIEQCGLKGFKIGGAQVSDKHANFILNIDNALAQDIYNVIAHIQKTVWDKKNVELQREVKLVGFDHVTI
jgi:UDP-N-acetylmuramate dehydrogenase